MNFPLSTYSAWRMKNVSEGNKNISKKASSSDCRRQIVPLRSAGKKMRQLESKRVCFIPCST